VAKSFEDIIDDIVSYIREVHPDLDTKVGSVTREVFIEPTAYILYQLYDELERVRDAQTISTATGYDLDRIASNFAVVRKEGAAAFGTLVVTFNITPSDKIIIRDGTIVSTFNGIDFRIIGTYTIDGSYLSYYESIANKYRLDFNKYGVVTTQALEVHVEAVNVGSSGNVGVNQIKIHNIQGINEIINLEPTTGGTDVESDESLRDRLLLVFTGSNVGTLDGYRAAVLQSPYVEAAYVLGPNDEIDGKKLKDKRGNTAINIYIRGINEDSYSDTFIYSSTGENAKEFLLGTNAADYNYRPVTSIVSVEGGNSGVFPVDNYTFVADTKTEYAGSVKSQDILKWLKFFATVSKIVTRSDQYNGIDKLGHSNIIKINTVSQSIAIENELIILNTENFINSTIQLKRNNIISVSSVVNVNTGREYSIAEINSEVGTITLDKQSASGLSYGHILRITYAWNRTYEPLLEFIQQGFDSIRWIEKDFQYQNDNNELLSTSPLALVSQLYKQPLVPTFLRIDVSLANNEELYLDIYGYTASIETANATIDSTGIVTIQNFADNEFIGKVLNVSYKDNNNNDVILDLTKYYIKQNMFDSRIFGNELLLNNQFKIDIDTNNTILNNGDIIKLSRQMHHQYWSTFEHFSNYESKDNNITINDDGSVQIESFDITNYSEVNTDINEDTTWSGNIYVTEDITVNPNVTLTISPGTKVFFKTAQSLNQVQSVEQKYTVVISESRTVDNNKCIQFDDTEYGKIESIYKITKSDGTILIEGDDYQLDVYNNAIKNFKFTSISVNIYYCLSSLYLRQIPVYLVNDLIENTDSGTVYKAFTFKDVNTEYPVTGYKKAHQPFYFSGGGSVTVLARYAVNNSDNLKVYRVNASDGSIERISSVTITYNNNTFTIDNLSNEGIYVIEYDTSDDVISFNGVFIGLRDFTLSYRKGTGNIERRLKLIVEGRLEANATENEFIIFTSSAGLIDKTYQPEKGDWGGIQFDNYDEITPSILNYVKIYYSYDGIIIYDSNPRIINTAIIDCLNCGINNSGNLGNTSLYYFNNYNLSVAGARGQFPNSKKFSLPFYIFDYSNSNKLFREISNLQSSGIVVKIGDDDVTSDCSLQLKYCQVSSEFLWFLDLSRVNESHSGDIFITCYHFLKEPALVSNCSILNTKCAVNILNGYLRIRNTTINENDISIKSINSVVQVDNCILLNSKSALIDVDNYSIITTCYSNIWSSYITNWVFSSSLEGNYNYPQATSDQNVLFVVTNVFSDLDLKLYIKEGSEGSNFSEYNMQKISDTIFAQVVSLRENRQYYYKYNDLPEKSFILTDDTKAATISNRNVYIFNDIYYQFSEHEYQKTDISTDAFFIDIQHDNWLINTYLSKCFAVLNSDYSRRRGGSNLVQLIKVLNNEQYILLQGIDNISGFPITDTDIPIRENGKSTLSVYKLYNKDEVVEVNLFDDLYDSYDYDFLFNEQCEYIPSCVNGLIPGVYTKPVINDEEVTFNYNVKEGTGSYQIELKNIDTKSLPAVDIKVTSKSGYIYTEGENYDYKIEVVDNKVFIVNTGRSIPLNGGTVIVSYKVKIGATACSSIVAPKEMKIDRGTIIIDDTYIEIGQLDDSENADSAVKQIVRKLSNALGSQYTVGLFDNDQRFYIQRNDDKDLNIQSVGNTTRLIRLKESVTGNYVIEYRKSRDIGTLLSPFDIKGSIIYKYIYSDKFTTSFDNITWTQFGIGSIKARYRYGDGSLWSNWSNYSNYSPYKINTPATYMIQVQFLLEANSKHWSLSEGYLGPFLTDFSLLLIPSLDTTEYQIMSSNNNGVRFKNGYTIIPLTSEITLDTSTNMLDDPFLNIYKKENGSYKIVGTVLGVSQANNILYGINDYTKPKFSIDNSTQCKVKFVKITANDQETVYFTKEYTEQITSKRFWKVNFLYPRLYLNKQIVSASNQTIEIYSMNQPNSNENYIVDYSYEAPVDCELITVNYTYNSAVREAQRWIDLKKDVTADVLVYQAKSVDVYVSVEVEIYRTFNKVTKQTEIEQAISNFITGLPSFEKVVIHPSDIITLVHNISGVDNVVLLNLSTDENVVNTTESISTSITEYFVLKSATVIVNYTA